MTATLASPPEARAGDDPAEPPDRRVSLRERLGAPMPTDRLFGWLGPLAVALAAGVLRFWHVTQPRGIYFDEVYYTKDAYSLLSKGYELNDSCTSGGFVVHPPLGKWMMAASEWIFGYTDCAGVRHGSPELGWRFAGALVGTIAVLVIARTARRMFRSTILGCFAGLLLGVDGLSFVMSRIGILDIFLMFWVVCALGCLVRDRDWGRERLAVRAAAADRDDPGGYAAWDAVPTHGHRLVGHHLAPSRVRADPVPVPPGAGLRSAVWALLGAVVGAGVGALAAAAIALGTGVAVGTGLTSGGGLDAMVAAGSLGATVGGLVPRLPWIARVLGDAGPKLGLRPWRLATGICLGASMAVKWSGLYTIVGFAILAVAWDVGARRSAGVRQPVAAFFRKDLLGWLPAFLVLPIAVYTASWIGWFLHPQAYDHNLYGSGFWNVFRGWLRYHKEIRYFHEHLSTPHPYASKPLSWLVLGRPVAFYYSAPKLGAQGCHAAGGCAREVLALGNPAVWWVGTAALVGVLGVWVARRDWRAATIVVGFLSGFLPWLLFPDRTMFVFYALPLLPFLVLALTQLAGIALGPRTATDARRTVGALIVGGYTVLVVVLFAYFYPILAAQSISNGAWRARMWFPAWI